MPLVLNPVSLNNTTVSILVNNNEGNVFEWCWQLVISFLLEYHVIAFKISFPHAFLFLSLSQSLTCCSQLNFWSWYNLVLISLLYSNSAGWCGVLRFISNKLSISDLRILLFKIIHNSPFSWGQQGVARLCSIPLFSRYSLKWLRTNWGPLSTLREHGRRWVTNFLEIHETILSAVIYLVNSISKNLL